MTRTAFSFSRDLEYATEPELAKRVGAGRHLWLRAAVKELIDNSLDGAEEAGIAPEIRVTVTTAGTLTVTDNGPGMPPELVGRICDPSQRTSAREAYAAPDRGSQGNALPTLMCLPLGLGREQAVTVITSRGVEHTITQRVNRLEGRREIERVEREVPDPGGASITVGPIPAGSLLVGAALQEARDLVASYSWLARTAGSGSTASLSATAARRSRSGRPASRCPRIGTALSASGTACCSRSSAIPR